MYVEVRHHPVRPAVADEIGLAVAVEVEPAQHDAARDGLLEDAGAHGLAVEVLAADLGSRDG